MYAAAAQVGVAIAARLTNVTFSPSGGFRTEDTARQNLGIIRDEVRSDSFSQFEFLNDQQAYLNAKIAHFQGQGTN
ncbi:hypothetical protein LG047_04765 [Methylocystis sp. WRRC1]|uniref:hypothetical protein n=1 Tax=unclassified Methylocystis TaxID=2625913 RepID=UPI0002F81F06|nr:MULTISPECIES: hypothetical protein [unclassified Methylocystis]MCC3244636.1 hypothetical protein [Methylocystis sp. WRRC1]